MSHHRLMIAGALSLAVNLTAGHGELCLADGGAGSTTAALVDKVEAFFRSGDPKGRDALASSIADAAGGDALAVARAIQSAKLWAELPADPGAFSFDSAAIGPIQIRYILPDGYDPARQYPVILCMPDSGVSADGTLALAGVLLSLQTGEFILVCPDRCVGGAFRQAPAAAEDVPRLVRDIRKRLHTDTDRTYLFGVGAGGEAAWLTAIAHADLFAGAVTVSAYPRVIYPQQTYTLLLGNLRDLPVLTVWSSADDARATARQKAIAAHNRGIVEFAVKASLPIKGVELPYDSPHLMPADEVSALLNSRRPKPGNAVSHWFRYTAHGKAGWLRQTKHAGEIWQAEQLSILPSPATDRDSFIQDVIKAKLGYVGGRIDGHTINIDTSRCARIDLLFFDGMIDLANPVTVVCNGRRRHEGMILPSIKAMLGSAYAGWDFQRLVWARRSFSIKVGTVSP